MATDWAAIKTEYVHGSVTMRELAEKHGIKAAGVMRRAAKEGWEAERKQKSAEVSKGASEALTAGRTDELVRFNAADLEMAKAIRTKAEAMMKEASTPQDLKAIAGAIDTAQKVGRLALGASTENSTVTTKELPASIDEFV